MKAKPPYLTNFLDPRRYILETLIRENSELKFHLMAAVSIRNGYPLHDLSRVIMNRKPTTLELVMIEINYPENLLLSWKY